MLDRAKHTSGKSLPFLRNINVRWGHFQTDDLLEMFFDADQIERYSVRSGDLVVCEGASLAGLRFGNITDSGTVRVVW